MSALATAADAVADARLKGLDRERKVTGIYARMDGGAKQAAKLAFSAYSEAVATGDAEIEAAARRRFLEASAKLQGGRRP